MAVSTTAFHELRTLDGPFRGEIRMVEPSDCFHTAHVMIAEPDERLAKADKLYSVCFYGRGWIVPEMQFLEAATDDEAYALVDTLRPWMTREIWDRHRLVRVLSPTIGDAHSH